MSTATTSGFITRILTLIGTVETQIPFQRRVPHTPKLFDLASSRMKNFIGGEKVNLPLVLTTGGLLGWLTVTALNGGTGREASVISWI